MLCRGSIENEVGRRYVARIADSSERRFSVFVQVEINVADFFDTFFAPTAGAIFERIHAHEHYAQLEGVFIDLELERHDPSLLEAD